MRDINKDIAETFRKARALLDSGIDPTPYLPVEDPGAPASCNHWPGQKRCMVCGMGLSETDRRT
jgi:hypothetical protein